MQETGITAGRHVESAGTLYDRFARLYELTFKLNGYERSLVRHLRAHPLPALPAGARVLDAGCGTGLLTLALLRTLERPAQISAVDLSAPSLARAQRAVENLPAPRKHRTQFAQANVLALPFVDEAFDLVVTSGVLEYVPLADGMRELARVLRPGGHLFLLPVRPSPVTSLIEVVYRFDAHPPREVSEQLGCHFKELRRQRFPALAPIGWTKEAILAQKP